MSVEIIKSKIRDVVDFPQKGIVFRDLTTVFKDADCLRELSDMLTAIYAEKGITKVVGIESRGFIMGPILATRIGAGFVPMRKCLTAEIPAQEYPRRQCRRGYSLARGWRKSEKSRPDSRFTALKGGKGALCTADAAHGCGADRRRGGDDMPVYSFTDGFARGK